MNVSSSLLPYKITPTSLVLLVFYIVLSCSGPKPVDPKIGLVGSSDSLQKVDEALGRMGKHFELIKRMDPTTCATYDLIILNRGAHAKNDAGLADNYQVLLSYVHNGGCLLVFGIDVTGYRREFLPYEIRFAPRTIAGREEWDYTEEIALPGHPISTGLTG